VQQLGLAHLGQGRFPEPAAKAKTGLALFRLRPEFHNRFPAVELGAKPNEPLQPQLRSIGGIANCILLGIAGAATGSAGRRLEACVIANWVRQAAERFCK
jgi:hypothetical protein